MDTTTALDALRSLTSDDVRRRLDELEAESQSLRTLLRATLARERATARAAELDADARQGVAHAD